MKKIKENCPYELLCLTSKRDKDKYDKFINDMKSLVGNIKIEEKDWKPTYSIKNLEVSQYLLIHFSSSPIQVQQLEKNFLQSTPSDVLNRYLLLNLEKEKKTKKVKIKLNKKNAE